MINYKGKPLPIASITIGAIIIVTFM